MPSLANQFVARAARLILTVQDNPALWTISLHGRVVGSLICRAGAWRLAWFEGADRRLAGYVGPVDGDVEALAETLSARLGGPVHFESLPV